jgi:predicted ATPase
LARLRRVILNGFKSIKAMDLELRSLNVLIGANGAGKSNLVSFFKMLHEMMAGRLQHYVGTTGRAQSLLHFGPKVTPQMEAQLELPALIIVDEPALGLHPYALNVIAALFRKASHHTQVLVSTQSTSFLDQFDPEDVIVVNREGKESQFTRPDPARLEAWLDEYSLGEVWEKNVIGGGPH